MSGGTLRLTLRDIETMVSYPPKPKNHIKLEPHTSTTSNALVLEYQASVRARKAEAARFKMTAATATKIKPATGPNAVKMLVDDGQAALAQGNAQDALSYFLESVRMGNTSAEIYTMIGELYQSKGMYSEALEFYTRSISANPMNCDMYLRRGDCHLSMQNYSDAIEEYLKYMKLEDPSQEVLVRSAKVALDADRVEVGDALLKVALERYPEEPYVHYLTGDVYERMGDSEASRLSFSRVMELDAAFPEPYIKEAEENFEKQNFVASLNLFQAVLKLLPTDANIYLRLADVYEVLGPEFLTNHVSCLTNALEFGLSPQKQPDAYVRRAEHYFKSKQLDEAIADLSLCIDIDPRHPRAREMRAEAYVERSFDGDLAAAFDDYEVFVELSVDSARKAYPYVFLAEKSFEQEHHDQAGRFYSLAVFCGYPSAHLDRMKIAICCSNSFLASSLSTTWMEPRLPQDAATSKKPPIPVLGAQPIQCRVLDTIYATLRDEEPTVHDALELQLIGKWSAYHDTVAKKREEFEDARLGKKGAAKKK
eukprot:PhM_4_TR6758/c0_g1_i1/m.16844